MSPADAEKEEACMEAILVTLTNLMVEEDKKGQLPLFDRTALPPKPE